MPLGMDRIQTLGRRGTGGINPGGGNLGGGRSLINGQIVQAQPEVDYTAENALPRSIEQQAGDYDEIMRGYRGVLNSPNGGNADIMARYQQLLQGMQGGPAQHTYGETEEFRNAYRRLNELAETGGLNAGEQADLRSRGTSPIRAVYANAQRNMDRNRRLSGGSANYNASAARMAREQSQGMADAMTNVNAGIAEMVQRGRLSAAPELGRLGEGSSQRMNQVGMFNADARNRHGQTMAEILASMGSLNSNESNRRVEALRGMTSLYGTTPALVNEFGNQVARNTQMNNQAMQATPRRRRGGAGVGMMMRPGY